MYCGHRDKGEMEWRKKRKKGRVTNDKRETKWNRMKELNENFIFKTGNKNGRKLKRYKKGTERDIHKVSGNWVSWQHKCIKKQNIILKIQ